MTVCRGLGLWAHQFGLISWSCENGKNNGLVGFLSIYITCIQIIGKCEQSFIIKKIINIKYTPDGCELVFTQSKI